MDDDIKRNLKKAARDTEIKIAKSLLKWMHTREGKKIPDDKILEHQSRLITDQAHESLSRGGKAAWDEIKRVFKKRRDEDSKN